MSAARPSEGANHAPPGGVGADPGAPVEPFARPEAGAAPTLAAFMAQAIAMEAQAAQRYDELADAMETHNNTEVAVLFRTMAGIERKHERSLLDQMGWDVAPQIAPALWERPGAESPETAPSGDVHYLMQPYHALEIALGCEERAAAFFARLAANSSGPVHQAAAALAEEEREHVELVKAWIAKVPVPAEDWAEDPDPPRYTD